ncbi:MAG: glycoside hydrolase family 3 C-terminal domain-containing protein [Bacteroidota bacterium]|nr:glycoside hydrolase family 3 C-terminal domain-containing protein [Bacteroidota bacterium]
MKIFYPLITLLLSSSLMAQLLPPDTVWVEQTLNKMTLDEKIGQLFMPVHRDTAATLAMIRKFNIGGIWFARSEAKKIAAELNTLQQASKYPLLVSADFEKGAGTYVDGATDLPANMALGASRDPSAAYRSAALTAKEARAIGVDIDFAPVLDVNNNPENPIINTRSFGENPVLVAALGTAAVKGYQENGLLATGKHFPGHGNTKTDSHAQLGAIDSSPEEFHRIELFPFKAAINNAHPSAIMSEHMWIKAIDADTVPATLSKNVMTNLLRDTLHFNGVVYTDAMVMGGISSRYSFDTAVVKAIQAGCDVILFPGDLEKGINTLKQAVQSGEISEERINESVRRILLSKTEVGLQKERLVDVEKIPSVVGTEENYREAKAIAAECITLAKDEKHLVPLRPSQKVVVFTMTNKSGNSMQSRGLISFPDEMKAFNASTIDYRLPETVTPDEAEKAVAAARNADVVVVSAYIKIVIASGTVDLPKEGADFLGALVKENPNVILVSFGNPYIGGTVPEIPTYICAYDNAKALQAVTAEALYGKIPFRGKLPVTISDAMRFGTGLAGK